MSDSLNFFCWIHIWQVSFSASRVYVDATCDSPVRCQHRRLPVIPRPRFPVSAILPPVPSSSAMFAPIASPFCFSPSSVDRPTTAAVPSVPPFPLLPPSFCVHPAFWGPAALPLLLIGRALVDGQQVPDEEKNLGLRHRWSTSGTTEPRRLGDHVASVSKSKCPDAIAAPASTCSGLEDMARMVSRLDDAQTLIVWKKSRKCQPPRPGSDFMQRYNFMQHSFLPRCVSQHIASSAVAAGRGGRRKAIPPSLKFWLLENCQKIFFCGKIVVPKCKRWGWNLHFGKIAGGGKSKFLVIVALIFFCRKIAIFSSPTFFTHDALDGVYWTAL